MEDRLGFPLRDEFKFFDSSSAHSGAFSGQKVSHVSSTSLYSGRLLYGAVYGILLFCVGIGLQHCWLERLSVLLEFVSRLELKLDFVGQTFAESF